MITLSITRSEKLTDCIHFTCIYNSLSQNSFCFACCFEKLHCVSKRTKFETVYLKNLRMDLDDIWQKYSKGSRVGCRPTVCMFQFSCRFAFYQLFVLHPCEHGLAPRYLFDADCRAHRRECQRLERRYRRTYRPDDRPFGRSDASPV